MYTGVLVTQLVFWSLGGHQKTKNKNVNTMKYVGNNVRQTQKTKYATKV